MKGIGKNLQSAVFLAVLFVFSSCGVMDVTLTDELVLKYVQAYKNMRAAGLADSSGKVSMDSKGLDKIVKEAGFKDTIEFMRVNMKIGAAMSVVQSEAYMKQMESMQSEDYGPWKDMLTNPDVPEESKKQIRDQISKSKGEYEKNKKYATPILDTVKNFTDKKSLEVVMRHQKELLEAYTGMSGGSKGGNSDGGE